MAFQPWDSAEGGVSDEEGFLREALGMSREQAQVGGFLL